MKKKRKYRLRTIFLLALTLASNSFAWFIYSTRVSSDITAKVRSWNVNFEIGDGDAEEYIEILIDSLYPGMNEYSKTLKAANHGEADAEISYNIEQAEVLGDNLKNLSLTDEQILNKLRNDYPFKITFDVSNKTVSAGGGEATITINIKWPYESGDDEKDTYWGRLAYDFNNNNPNTPNIKLVVKITAVQK